MDYFNNVVKSSNAIIQSSKEKLNNQIANIKTTIQDQTQSTDSTTLASSEEIKSTIQQASSSNSNDQTTIATDPSSNNNNNGPAIEGGSDEQNVSGARSGSMTGIDGNFSDKMNSQFAAIAADAEIVTQKTVKGAKNIGNFLFSMGNKAGQTVMQTAKQVKQVVENTSILTDFTREQQEFIKEHGGSLQAGGLPWEDCENETIRADVREQVLTLSQDRRNFVRSPPNDFQFDPQLSYPIALSLLKEDPNLGKMRFELVPKLISEDNFWRNYFYRVSLLKQMSERGEDIKRQSWASSRSSSGEGPDEVTFNEVQAVNPGEGSLANPNYTINDSQISASQPYQQHSLDKQDAGINQELESSESRKLVAEADDLKSKLRELNIGSFEDGSGQDENKQWEEELQKDLQEFELVSGDVSALDEEALDRDIMEMKKNLK